MADPAVAQRLRAVLSMYEFGEQMYRAKLRRDHPAATDAEIEAMVRAWRLDRPGAPFGDAVGRPSRRPGVATPDDMALADEAVRLISQRGYQRGRDLVSALATLRPS